MATSPDGPEPIDDLEPEYDFHSLRGVVRGKYASRDRERLVNSAVEFHDSTLAGIDAAGRGVVIRLAPAYVHRSDGRPGVDPGSGWLQDVDLVISDAVVESSRLELPCELADGGLSIGEARWENVIPLPLAAVGAAALTAVTCGGDRLTVRGSGVEVVPRGALGYVEPFPGSTDS